jgi:UDP-GlcNAc:undecaprenyl-phosphate GlcNAc-1-phosphate transferase
MVLAILGICSLGVSLVLTPFLRDFFGFMEMVDYPDKQRKVHTRPIPRIGGIPVAVSYFVALTVWLLMSPDMKGVLAAPSALLIVRLLPAAILVFATGLLDDFIGLTPWQKIAGQTLGAVWACWAGVRLASIPGHPFLAFAIYPVSVIWLVFCANAFNLIDGLDGLASGVALLASMSLLLAALIHRVPVLALLTVPLVGGLLGFLRYNFNPASIFLGDCGSLLIGFLLGCYGLMWNQHASTGFGKTAPLIAMALPVAEVGISILRRFLRQQPIFFADRNHIHHRLLSLGLTHRNAALVLYGASALAATLAVLQTIVHPHVGAAFLLLFCAVAYVGVRQLRYVEFRVLWRFIVEGEIRRALRMKICLKDYEQSLVAANSLEECWQAMRNACYDAGFSHVGLIVGGRSFEDELRPASDARGRWQLRIPLSVSDYALFTQDSLCSTSATLVVPIVEALQGKLKRLRRDFPARALEAAAAR